MTKKYYCEIPLAMQWNESTIGNSTIIPCILCGAKNRGSKSKSQTIGSVWDNSGYV